MCGGKNDKAVVSPELIQDLCAFSHIGLLSSQAVTTAGAIYPIEGRDAVYDEQAEGGPGAQSSLQIMQRKEELDRAGAMEHREAT